MEVEDLGEPGRADTIRIVLQDGYAAARVLLKGNIQVTWICAGSANRPRLFSMIEL